MEIKPLSPHELECATIEESLLRNRKIKNCLIELINDKLDKFFRKNSHTSPCVFVIDLSVYEVVHGCIDMNTFSFLCKDVANLYRENGWNVYDEKRMTETELYHYFDFNIKQH